ncbi:methyl-accepting chemotaxis protein [Campylobacterota bacterium]|nr:methyl-accepting chemotaxis protein [Campylobacterota bacterium]
MKNSTSNRLILTTLAVIISGFVILTLASAYLAYQISSENGLKNLSLGSLTLSTKLNGWFNLHKTRVEINAKLLAGAPPLTRAQIEDIFAEQIDAPETKGEYLEIYSGYVDGSASRSSRSPSPEGWIAYQRPWYQQAVKSPGVTSVTEPYLDAFSGGLCITLVHTIDDQVKIGVAAVDLSIKTVVDYLESANRGSAISSFIVSKSGNILVHQDKDMAPDANGVFKSLAEVRGGVYREISNALTRGNTNEAIRIEEGDGSRYFVMSEIPISGWFVVSSIPVSEITAPIYGVIRVILFIAVIIALIVALFLAFYISNFIAKPLTKVQETMSAIEKTGDFRKRIDVDSTDEVGTTAKTINHLLGSLQDTFKTILHAASQLDTASVQLTEVSQKVAKGSERTSDSSSDMAASVEEMTASINQVSDNAKETSTNAETMMELSKNGAEIVHRTVSEMQAMAEAVRNSSGTIAELGKQSEQISGIVQTIKDVADQTNLLALNAAIEAARAGEQGRGFAVVADEIRKLAERTTSATTEIAAMISAIQESSHTAVESMARAADRVSSGVELADQAGGAINNIKDGAGAVQSHVKDIASALNEQSSASQQIAAQVEKVAQATDENAEAAKHSSQAAINIANLSKSMRDSVSKFKV